jgi:hypothetical protein
VIFNDRSHLVAIVRAEKFFRNPRFEPVTGLQKPDCGNEKAAIEEQEKSAELHVAHQQRIAIDGSASVIPVENLNEARVASGVSGFWACLNDAMMRNRMREPGSARGVEWKALVAEKRRQRFCLPVKDWKYHCCSTRSLSVEKFARPC